MPHTPEEAASTAVSIRQAREDAKLQDTVRMTQHGNDQGHVTRVRLPKNHSWPMSRMLNQELINTITNLERGHISMDNGVSETHPRRRRATAHDQHAEEWVRYPPSPGRY